MSHINDIKKLADQGDVDAQYKLANMYEYADGVKHSRKEALKWYRLAAEQGHICAQYELGVKLEQVYMEEDKGGGENIAEAVSWTTLAAEQGHIPAQCFLGHLYEEGSGVNRDYEEAAKWYRLAADQGDGTAQYLLGILYEEGKGVKKNYEEAIKLYKLGAERGGDKDVLSRIGKMYEKGRGVPQSDEEAVKWYIRARDVYEDQQYGYKLTNELIEELQAKSGSAELQLEIANKYFSGEGRIPDFDKGLEWLKRAAKNGHAIAAQKLGNLYHKGLGIAIRPDEVQAQKWYKLAVKNGYKPAE